MRTVDIARNLYIRYGQVEEINDYYGLLAIFGLCQTAYESQEEDLLEQCRTILSRFPDEVRHPHYNFVSYRCGGNAQAWSMMMGLVTENKDLLKKYAEETMKGCTDSQGILSMPGSFEKEQIWIDVVTAVSPFMLYAGLVCQEERYIDFAAEQCFKMYEVFMDQTAGLLHQSRGFREDISLFSEDHWSRGNGWGYTGLAELIKYLPEDSRHREKAERYFLEMTDNIISYQTEHGLWRQEMTEPLSWEETSGSALFVYGIGAGIRLGYLDQEKYILAFQKGLAGLLKYGINEDFSTELSCPGCLCPGEGKNKGTIQAYITEKLPVKNEHHSFGAFILAFVEAHRNGIIEMER
ncbi:MAG: glycoside hydrolase family 88 protein [Clostridiaceae bacterium]|nr:glycoside hydrolase family 88 protein [Clostridiaceae bacterium]